MSVSTTSKGQTPRNSTLRPHDTEGTATLRYYDTKAQRPSGTKILKHCDPRHHDPQAPPRSDAATSRNEQIKKVAACGNADIANGVTVHTLLLLHDKIT